MTQAETSATELKNDNYSRLLMIIVPLLNFLSGITFDLHAPSLPAIAVYFSAPISSAKNTITIALFGFAAGCVFFGFLLDKFSKRPIILFALILYTFASFMALSCHTINELLIMRFIQGFTVACLSVGCRAIIINQFSGHQFNIALLYTSLAFSIGPIIAPFIGGILQFKFGWQSNFIGYGLVSSVILLTFMCLYAQQSANPTDLTVRNIFFYYASILRRQIFLPSVIIAGLGQTQLLIYTVIGAFLVENYLHYSTIMYGNTALIISCGYLLGVLTNRLLIKKYELYKLVSVGFGVLGIALLVQLMFSISWGLNLITLIVPITLIGYSNGFIFINIMTACLRSVTHPGMATALFTTLVMLISGCGIYFISHIMITTLETLFIIYAVLASIQCLVFYFLFPLKEIKNT